MGIANKIFSYYLKGQYENSNPYEKFKTWDVKIKRVAQQKYPEVVMLIIQHTQELNTLLQSIYIDFTQAKKVSFEKIRVDVERAIELCQRIIADRERAYLYYYKRFDKNIDRNIVKNLEREIAVILTFRERRVNVKQILEKYELYITNFLDCHGINPWDF